MPYLKRINSLPLINHISYKYAQVSDIGPSWSSCYSRRDCLIQAIACFSTSFAILEKNFTYYVFKRLVVSLGSSWFIKVYHEQQMTRSWNSEWYQDKE